MKIRETERVVQTLWNAQGRAKQWSRLEIADVASALLKYEVDPDEMSSALQSYRTAKRRSFDISAQSYGASAGWRILGVHGHISKRRKELTDAHRTYVTEDSLRRRVSDHVHEVLPAMIRNGASKDEIRQLVLAMRGEVYRTVANQDVMARSIPEHAEGIMAPVLDWFYEMYGEPA